MSFQNCFAERRKRIKKREVKMLKKYSSNLAIFPFFSSSLKFTANIMVHQNHLINYYKAVISFLCNQFWILPLYFIDQNKFVALFEAWYCQYKCLLDSAKCISLVHSVETLKMNSVNSLVIFSLLLLIMLCTSARGCSEYERLYGCTERDSKAKKVCS